MCEIKTFDDLKFEQGFLPTVKRARLKFKNGYGVSVITGTYTYTNNFDEYELAVLKDGDICYDTPITNDVIGYLSKDEVTEIMIKVQELK